MRFLYALVFVLCCALLGCGQSPMPSDASGSAGRPDGPTRSADDRKVIHTAEVELVVEEFSSFPERLQALAREHEAFVAKAEHNGSTRAPRTGRWTVRVPVSRYSAFLEGVKPLGELLRIQSNAQDVTEDYVDVQARLRNKHEEETRLVALLKDATGSLADVLAVERELMRVRGEIEQTEGRKRLLDDRTELATVIVHVQEGKPFLPEVSATYATRALRALSNSAVLLAATVERLSLVILALLPWLAATFVPGILIVLIRRRWNRPVKATLA